MTPIVNPLVAHRACFYIDDAKLGTRGSDSGRYLRDIVAPPFFFPQYSSAEIISYAVSYLCTYAMSLTTTLLLLS